MSVDRPPKRKTVAKQDAVSPKKPAKKKRPKSRTADNLEALLHLIDEGEASDAPFAAGRTPRKIASDRTKRPARERPPSAGEGSSFMQELARARAELHKERRSRIALDEEVETLRRDVIRLAANDSAIVDELRRVCAGLQKQLEGLEKQRQKLKVALLDSESELETLRQHLADIEQRPEDS